MLGGGLGSQGRWNPYMNVQFTQSGIDDARASFIDDFVGKGVNEYYWEKTGVGTATTPYAQIGTGRLSLSTGAVLNQDILLSTNGIQHIPAFGSDKKVEVEFNSVYFNAVTDVLARLELYNAANKYVRLEVDTATRGNANWWITRDNATGETAYDTTLAATTTASSRPIFKIIQNAANDVSIYYKTVGSTSQQKDYTLLLNFTTNIPTGYYEPRMYIKSLAGTDRIMYVDAFKFSSLRANV